MNKKKLIIIIGICITLILIIFGIFLAREKNSKLENSGKNLLSKTSQNTINDKKNEINSNSISNNVNSINTENTVDSNIKNNVVTENSASEVAQNSNTSAISSLIPSITKTENNNNVNEKENQNTPTQEEIKNENKQPEEEKNPEEQPEPTPEKQFTEEEKKYLQYNGKLHIEGRQVLNERNEPFQLNGIVITGVNYESWKNKDRLYQLKRWGFNHVRLGYSIAYIDDENNMQCLYNIVDYLTELGIYAEIVIWNDETSTQDQERLTAIKGYFEKVASRYKDNDNIIYGLGNEPSVGITQEMIEEYVNELIPVITKYNPDAIVTCPMPYADTSIDLAAHSKLTYNNVLYLTHAYLSMTQKCYGLYRKISTALANNKAVYINEWCAASPGTTDEYINTDEARNTAYLINKYNLPNVYYHYFPGGERVYENQGFNYMGIIKRSYWDDRYMEEDALSLGGIFITNNLKNKITVTNDLTDEENYTMINEGVNNLAYFWKDEYRSNIKKVTFDYYTSLPSNAVEIWNMSYTGLGDLYAYLTDAGDGKYNLYIVADKKIYLPEKSDCMFWKFSSVEEFVFNNIDTSNVTTMNTMFSGCSALKSIDLSKFNTSKVTNMRAMFGNTQALEEIDLSNFDMSKVENVGYMFFNSGITNLDFRNAEFTNVTNKEYMFAGSNPKVIVKNEAAMEFIKSIKNSLIVEIYTENN